MARTVVKIRLYLFKLYLVKTIIKFATLKSLTDLMRFQISVNDANCIIIYIIKLSLMSLKCFFFFFNLNFKIKITVKNI